jgi:hypothetical protein
MGPENSNAGSFELYTPGGEKMEMLYGMPPITVQAVKVPEQVVQPIQTMTFQVKLGRDHRCQSRKRFIKLLMSRGFGRNAAEQVAVWARHNGGYRRVWKGWLFWGVARL